MLRENKLFHRVKGVWSTDAEKEFDYSDGSADENALREILLSANDRGSRSLELEEAINSWVSDYHLSSERANIYRFLDLSDISAGLELGAGCGAIARYLGEEGISLDAVEGSVDRAELCSLRCQGLDNINIFHANFNDLKLPESAYDAIFFNGVLEYSSKFLPGIRQERDALVAVLERSLPALKPEGILCVAIENKMGLKYWQGAAEDHFGKPYVGLYGYPSREGIRTYDKGEWQDIFAGLSRDLHYRFIYPFPDYKMAKVILSDSFVKSDDHAYSLLYRVASTSNNVPLRTDMHEFLLWKELNATGHFDEYANSFFIVASLDPLLLDRVCPNDFMHFSGKGRKPQFRTITRKRKDQKVVTKQPVTGSSPGKAASLFQTLPDAEYISGPLLVSKWIHAVLDSDRSVFEKCIKDYYNFLLAYWEKQPEHGDAWDLLPFNIIIDQNDTYCVIDKEWHVQSELSPEYILFRALLWFPVSNESLFDAMGPEAFGDTREDFIQYGFDLVSLSLAEKVDQFIAAEEKFQQQVENQVRPNPVQGMLKEPLARRSATSEVSGTFLAQLYWTEDEGEWSEEKSVLESAKTGVDRQTLSFVLPYSAAGLSQLRFDPSDRPGFFRIYKFSLFCSPLDEDNDPELMWVLHNPDQIASVSLLQDVHYCRNGLGEVFVATSSDPFIMFDLPDGVKEKVRGRKLRVEFEMDWPKSSDYIVAMDALGTKLTKYDSILKRLSIVEKQAVDQADTILQQTVELEERRDQVKAKDIFIKTNVEKLETELEQMKQTRVWKTADWLREKFYYRLLDGKNLLRKSAHTVKHEGFMVFFRKARSAMSAHPEVISLGLIRGDYDLWLQHMELAEHDILEIKRDISTLRVKPLISIVVPVYNVDEVWLVKAIESVRNQLYENWELCLCDDCSPKPHIKAILTRYAELDKRIKIKLNENNVGIALTSNAALSMSTGDYVGLLDHDDELSIDALYENVKVINKHPGAALIYSDEDKMDMQGNRVDPFFKPDFSPELIYSQNYICHFSVLKKSILDEIGGFHEGFDGSQDHDLVLRVIDKAGEVYHIPKVLYHWRKIPGSTAAVYDSKSYAWEAGRRAIEESLSRSGVAGKVLFGKYQGTYRVQRTIMNEPLVSIIIPFKDKSGLLQTCISSILEKSTYSHFEVLGISNNSTEKSTLETMRSLAELDRRVRFLEHDTPFNFSEICNYGVGEARGEYVVLLNNDIEIVTGEWIEALLEHAQVENAGAVGGKLYYPDNRIQHAGIVIGMAGVAGLPHHFFHKEDVGYYARPHVIHNVSAVTGACMMVSKKLYQDVGGMDELNFGVAYNDVDFCLKLLQRGYRNVFTPYCEMIHYESLSRGYEDTPEKMQRLEKESNYFEKKWGEYIKKGDQYYSPHLSLKKENFSIRI